MLKRYKESEFIGVLSLMKPRILKYIVSVLLDSGFTSICYNIVLAYISKDVINAIAYGDISLLKRALYIAVGSFLIAFILQPIIRYCYRCCVRSTMGSIRLKAFEHMESLEVQSFEDRHSGDLITRMTNDIDTIEQVYVNHIPTLVFAIIHGVVAIISMFIMEWRLAIVAIVMGIVSVLISTLYSKPLRRASDDAQGRLGDMTQRLIDILDGFQAIKMFNIEKKIFDKYKNGNRELYQASFRRGKLNCTLEEIISLFGDLKSIGILTLGLYMSLKEGVDIGTIVAIVQLQGNASFLFENIGQFISGIQGSLAGATRVFEILNSPSEVEDNKDHNENDTCLSRRIEMKDVYFSYKEDERILNGLDISVEEGKMTAVVGPSGGGKSTLIKLLMGFYRTDSGEILIGGKPITDRSLKALRKMIAYVPQDSYLFYGTIEENIRYGRIDASSEEIMEVAKMAYAHDFITELPDGYNTMVGEMGANLSGGQRQRIAIARALLKNAPILLLDEATSALDSESEQLVQLALDRLMHGRTTIAIAHRLSTIEAADRIYVLQNGVIIESGVHRELLLKEGVYKHLYQLQFANEKTA